MRTVANNKVSRLLLALVAGAGAAAFSGTAVAHHSFAMFDMAKTVTLEGTVKEFKFSNPHIWIELAVMDTATGSTTVYSLEGGSPNNLMRAGWKRDSIRAGDKASITIHPRRNGEPGGALVTVVIGGVRIGNQ